MSRRLRSLRNRGVLITGASSGIGRQMAVDAAQAGARVGLVARRRPELESVAKEIRSGGGVAHPLPSDVTVRESMVDTIRRAEALLGPIDVGILNAGVGRHRALLEHDLDDAEQLLRTNVFGTLYAAQPLARAMVRRGEGWLVFVGSIAGLVPVPGEAVYSASKHAVVGLAEALSMEVEPLGVHVLTVCPGAVRTGFVPHDELDRVPAAARATSISAEDVSTATLRGLARGERRVIVPARLKAAVAARALFADLVRAGTIRATRSALERAGVWQTRRRGHENTPRSAG